VTIGATEEPTADFTFSPASPVVNSTVNFDASDSTAPEGRDIDTYQWNFGDGSTTGALSSPLTSHAYTEAGAYVVTLTVTDSADRTATSTQTVTIGGTELTAEFTFSPTDPRTGTLVTFDAAESVAPEGRTITEYRWNFGDIPDQREVQATGRIATHSYAEAFTYTVTLTVIDNTGQSATTSQEVAVDGDPPNAAFTFTPQNPTTSSVITFNATGATPGDAGTIVEYIWDYGDGTTFTTTAAIHVKSGGGTYATAQSYTVKLTIVTSTGATDSETRTIVIGSS
jgi:PKD repeat protein